MALWSWWAEAVNGPWNMDCGNLGVAAVQAPSSKLYSRSLPIISVGRKHTPPVPREHVLDLEVRFVVVDGVVLEHEVQHVVVVGETCGQRARAVASTAQHRNMRLYTSHFFGVARAHGERIEPGHIEFRS